RHHECSLPICARSQRAFGEVDHGNAPFRLRCGANADWRKSLPRVRIVCRLGMICPVAKAQDCPQCVASDPPEPPLPTGLWLMTTHVNEVNVLFIAAHKGGASLSDLSRDDILVRDDNKPPAAVLGFRTEHELG